MKRTALILNVVLLLAVAACQREDTDTSPEIVEGTPEETAVGAVVALEQGWTEDEQTRFWFTPQGSQLMPYSWFLALEQPASTELFRSDESLESYRFILQEPGKWNPDGLPIGFAKHSDQGQEWVGVSCAACHTALLRYQGTGILINGGPGMVDFFAFLDGLAAATTANHDDDAKFERFAARVLGSGHDASQASELRDQLASRDELLNTHQRSNAHPNPYGFARLDAFGVSLNQMTAINIGMEENLKIPDAPVCYPFLWDTSQTDRVEWNGFGTNAGAGRLARNIVESLGVFVRIEVKPDAIPPGYPSSVKVRDLGELERLSADLWSPQWPEEFLPPIDRTKAENGSQHYQTYCVSCHVIIDRTDPDREIKAVLTDLDEIGTDPAMTTNFADRKGKTGILEGTKVMIVAGDRFGSEASGVDFVLNQAIGIVLRNPIDSVEAIVEDYRKVFDAKQMVFRGYRTRPLDGIWATAPYLHNGSVPDLFQLLQPVDQRVKEFHLGNWEFDPVNVGYERGPSEGSSRLDTSLPGNSNAGHTYGTTELTDEQKWELVEYLKTL